MDRDSAPRLVTNSRSSARSTRSPDHLHIDFRTSDEPTPGPQLVSNSRERSSCSRTILTYSSYPSSFDPRLRSGSFIWDVYDAILYQSAGFVVHGLACLAIFAFSFVSLFDPSPREKELY